MISGALGGSFSGAVGGFITGLALTGDLDKAWSMASQGAIYGGIAGLALGGYRGYKDAKALGRNPWTGETKYYRRGTNFTLKNGEYKINPANGLVKPTHGLSVNIDPTNLEKFGGANAIDYLPDGLKIIQRGANLSHFEIVPSSEMSFDEYQNLLNQIKIK